MRTFAWLAAIAISGSVPAHAAPAPRQPTSKWEVDYGEAHCIALRNYGTDAKPVLLMLKPSPGGSVMRVILAQKGYAVAHQLSGKVRFGASPAQHMDLLSYGDANGKMRIVSMNIPMDQFRANIGMIDLALESVDASGDYAITSLPGVIAELDKCSADLRQYWHYGEKTTDGSNASGPVRPLHDLFSPLDYPAEAVADHQEGSVTMTFLVDQAGKVADCSVDQTSGVPVLDTMSCYIIQQRARFRPALEADGKPRRSSYTQTVTWRLQG